MKNATFYQYTENKINENVIVKGLYSAYERVEDKMEGDENWTVGFVSVYSRAKDDPTQFLLHTKKRFFSLEYIVTCFRGGSRCPLYIWSDVV